MKPHRSSLSGRAKLLGQPDKLKMWKAPNNPTKYHAREVLPDRMKLGTPYKMADTLNKPTRTKARKINL
jgi:hypothetical protein